MISQGIDDGITQAEREIESLQETSKAGQVSSSSSSLPLLVLPPLSQRAHVGRRYARWARGGEGIGRNATTLIAPMLPHASYAGRSQPGFPSG